MLPVIERRCSMADETTKTPDEQLLKDILNELDMTLADESMQKKIKDIMQRGKVEIIIEKHDAFDFRWRQKMTEIRLRNVKNVLQFFAAAGSVFFFY